MNERIEELAGQAFQYASDHADDSGKGSLGVFAERFAELLVKECVDIANNQFSVASGLDDRDCWTAAEIKKHFGVEE